MKSFDVFFHPIFDKLTSVFSLIFCFRVPGNSAAVNTLQEELNNRGIENVCLEDEVRTLESGSKLSPSLSSLMVLNPKCLLCGRGWIVSYSRSGLLPRVL